MKKKSFLNIGHTMDLTEGNIFSSLMVFALPLLAGNILQTLYNSVDSIVIGQMESSAALAAVAASSSIATIVSGFFTGMSAGASAVFSRYFGAKDYKSLHDSVHTTMLFSAIFGLALAGLGIVFTPSLLNVTNCPAEIMQMAQTYLQVYLIGVFFTCLYNIAAAVLRSVGDSLSPFIALLISSIMNIFLDIFFVGSLGMGVLGVAAATIISQCVSMIIVFIRCMRLDGDYRFRFSHLMIKWKLLGEIARLGFPAGVQSSIQAIGALYVQSFTNSFSSVAIAGIGSAQRVDQFAGMACNAIGLAMTTFTGQNIGAGKYGRTHRAVGISAISCIIYVIALGIPMYIFAPQLIGVFSPDPEVMFYGTGFLRVIMPVYFLMAGAQLLSGVLRGYGYSISAMICMLAGFVGVRLIWLNITLNYISHDVQYLYWSYPVGWAAGMLPMLFIYLFIIRKKFPAERSA